MSKFNKRNNKQNQNYKDKSNSKSKKPQMKDDGMEGDNKDKEYKGYRNDASDYIPNPMIRSQVGHFSYNSTIGIPDRYLGQIAGDTVTSGTTLLGTVLEMKMFTNIGVDAEAVGTNIPVLGINAAALKFYNAISADNGKTTKELPEDIAMAIVAVGEFVSAVANYQRAYGTAFASNFRNRTVPKTLIKAMGFNPDDFFLHLSDGRLRMNRLLSMARNIRLPYDIKWFLRSWELYSHIFYDKGSAMGQYYVTRPMGFFKYYENYDPTASNPRQLVEAKFYTLSDNMSVNDYLDVVEDMLHRILESSLFNYVFTDIVKYMEKHGGSVLTFNTIPEFYAVEPEFSETFMNQVHNMSWGMFTNVGDNYIISDQPLKLSLISNLACGADSIAHARSMGGDQILDFPYTDNPDADMAIDALAFKTIVDYFEGEGGVEPNTFKAVAVPPHPVHSVYVHTAYTSTSGQITFSRFPMPYVFDRVTEYDDFMSFCVYWETFDVKPILWIHQSNDFPKTPFGNLNFWTQISQRQLARIYDFYFLGMFEAEIYDGKSYN